MTDQQPRDDTNTKSGGNLVYAVTLIIAAGIGLLAAWIIWSGTDDQPSTVQNNGEAVRSLREWKATPFALSSIDGETVSLADLRGRTVFLNFWGTWCQPCRREFPAFQEFMSEQPEDGPLIVTINQGQQDDDVLDFMEDLGISDLMILMDYELDLADDYPSTVLPATFIIDGDGFVRFRTYGEVTKADLYDFLDKLEVES